MQSLINVECPHCKTRGQILVPPVGSIIIGPCPQCSELVVIFCGQVLALDKDVMQSEDIESRRTHLLTVLNEFLQERISTLMTEDFVLETESLSDAGETEDLDFTALKNELSGLTEELSLENVSMSYSNVPENQGAETISQTEVDRFTDIDLKLLDNKAYFKSVFGS